ncbi:hypothetical protein [Leptolyngbya sp. FACHB-16]|uniref:hypothetical protein n=1 Tax=unclassified Leptolyngbya TaxID=2650499 RepID=UPI00168439DD|nr:hypothetical protein [Leptolyngbya sp. FACHB-16]MBD2153081.1 hypothetical protein [Leptolyngbya sp. FACHB-16]
MTLARFSQQALNLLYVGVLYRERLLEVYCFIKSYEAGQITSKAVQDLLDQYGPDMKPPLPFSDEESPS